MNWYLKVLKQYADFKGRARRKEYWMFTLFNVIIIMTLAIIIQITTEDFTNTDGNIASILLALYVLFIIIPHLAVVVRRLHDINKSGWYWFIRFIPLIGQIWLLILLVEDSHSGKNKWGDNPKGIGNNNAIQEIGTE